MEGATMSIEETIDYKNARPFCAVCGKGVDYGGGFARVNHKGTMVNLCCPLCLETFQKDPAPYMLKLGKIYTHQVLSGIVDSNKE
jgi:hypothetical protein